MDLDEAFGLPLLSRRLSSMKSETEEEESDNEVMSNTDEQVSNNGAEHIVDPGNVSRTSQANTSNQSNNLIAVHAPVPNDAVRARSAQVVSSNSALLGQQPSTTVNTHDKACDSRQAVRSFLQSSAFLSTPATVRRVATVSSSENLVQPDSSTTNLKASQSLSTKFELKPLTLLEGDTWLMPEYILELLRTSCIEHRRKYPSCMKPLWTVMTLTRERNGRTATFVTNSGVVLDASRFRYGTHQQIIIARDPNKTWKAGLSVVIVYKPGSNRWAIWNGQPSLLHIPARDVCVKRVLGALESDPQQTMTEERAYEAAGEATSVSSPNCADGLRLKPQTVPLQSVDQAEDRQGQQLVSQMKHLPADSLDTPPDPMLITPLPTGSTIVVNRTSLERYISPISEHNNTFSTKSEELKDDGALNASKGQRAISVSSDSDQPRPMRRKKKIAKTSRGVHHGTIPTMQIEPISAYIQPRQYIIKLKYKTPVATPVASTPSLEDTPSITQPTPIPATSSNVKLFRNNMPTPETSIGEDSHTTKSILDNIVLVFKDLGGSTTRVRPFVVCNTSQKIFKQAWVAKLAYEIPIAIAVTFADKQVRLWKDDEDDFQTLKEGMQASLAEGWTDAEVVVTL